jgi:hypothetical protein
MLPSELLIHKHYGETIAPKRLAINDRYLSMACDLIDCFQESVGQTQAILNQRLLELEGDSPDYRIKRGLAHLLRSDSFSKFEIISPLEPQELRQRVYSLAAQSVPTSQNSEKILTALAGTLSQELGREILPVHLRTGLYADLQENRILTQFDSPGPQALLHRYNLAQVQGIFYRASQIALNAHRNVPGEYKLLFRYLKFFGLMAYIEGDADRGFTISIDGPVSLFKPSTRYGLAIAKFLPALLHVTKWSLTATLQLRDFYTGTMKTGQFSLNSDCGLVTHYPPSKTYDSMLEASFASRWAALKTDWALEREVDLIPIPGSVMIPDFRLVHPDGRSFLLEIVGYWRPEYLQKKFSQVRQSGCDNLILAISERLNLEKAGVNVTHTPAIIVWFKDKLSPQAVLTAMGVVS